MKSFLYIFLATVIYGIVHSFMASLWLKTQVRRLAGAEADRWYRLFYNAFAVISLVPVLAMVALMPDRTLYAIPFPITILTVGIQVLAFAALVYGVWQTGMWSFVGIQQFLDPAKPKRPRLVLNGLYRYMRHPLYTAGFVLIWLTPVMTLNLLALNLGLSVYLWLGAMVEERKLVHEHGADYQAYRQSTPMLVPRFERTKDEGRRTTDG